MKIATIPKFRALTIIPFISISFLGYGCSETEVSSSPEGGDRIYRFVPEENEEDDSNSDDSQEQSEVD